MEYTVIGDEVNIAAHPQGIATSGEVTVSEPTYRRVGILIEATPLVPIMLKGKNKVVGVYWVDGLTDNE